MNVNELLSGVFSQLFSLSNELTQYGFWGFVIYTVVQAIRTVLPVYFVVKFLKFLIPYLGKIFTDYTKNTKQFRLEIRQKELDSQLKNQEQAARQLEINRELGLKELEVVERAIKKGALDKEVK